MEKSLKMYISNPNTILYKMIASGKTIHLIGNFKDMSPIGILRLPNK